MLARKLLPHGTARAAAVESTRSRSFSFNGGGTTFRSPAGAPRRSWRETWFGYGALLQLANTYYAGRMVLVTLTACVSMLLLSIFAFDMDGVWIWMVFQSANTVLGASALPSVCLYSIVALQRSDDGRKDETIRTSLDAAISASAQRDTHGRVLWSFRDIETTLEPFLLKRSSILRLCEVIVVVERVLLYVVVAIVVVLIWIHEASIWTTMMNFVRAADGLILLTVLCVLLQTKEFDRLRAHEQLQLGAGLDQDQLEYTTFAKKKRVVRAGRLSRESTRSSLHESYQESATPTGQDANKALQLGKTNDAMAKILRRGLYEAAVNRDHDKARALLDALARALKSKKKTELFLLKLYATPTLWLWSFAFMTYNPLHVACRLGDDVMVDILLKGGLHPDLLDKTQGAPFSLRLLYEVCQGRTNQTINVLATPLHVAVVYGHTKVIDMLAAHRANPNIFAQSSFYSQSMRVPPIFLADSAEIIATLIRHRANFLIVPGKGNAMSVTVLQRAMLHGRNDLSNVLKEWGADVALTPLHEAAAVGAMATVRHYLSLGIPPDQLGEFHDGVHQRTPLHWASVMGRHDVVVELLARKADVNKLDVGQRTPLHWAARHCHIETMTALFKAGANPLMCDEDGLTPLAFSAAGGLLDGIAVELFIQYGVDVNEQLPNVYGDTCLHLALREGHREAALALIQSGGADLSSYNALGEPAIKCCASAEQLYAIKLISKWVDIVISYDSAYRQLADHLKQGIEESFLTVSMRDPHAATAQQSMDAMSEASAVVCILTPGFERNPICMEELAFAKESRLPVMAITIGTMDLPEELQVYLFTRQLVPFGDAIIASRRRSSVARRPNSMSSEDSRELRFKLDDVKFKRSLQNLIDGLRDEVELHHLALAAATEADDDHDQALTFRPRSFYTQRTGRTKRRNFDALMTNDGPFMLDSGSLATNTLLRGGNGTTRGGSPTRGNGTTRGGFARAMTTRRFAMNEVVMDTLSRRHGPVPMTTRTARVFHRTSVFLSHGDCHTEFVTKLHQELMQVEINVTLDSISNVASMKDRILAAKDAILQCDVFLVVLSEKSVKTELVSDQLAFAEDKGKYIVPIYYTQRPGIVSSTVQKLLDKNDRPVRIFGNGISYGRGLDELLEEITHEQQIALQRLRAYPSSRQEDVLGYTLRGLPSPLLEDMPWIC